MTDREQGYYQQGLDYGEKNISEYTFNLDFDRINSFCPEGALAFRKGYAEGLGILESEVKSFDKGNPNE